MAITFYDEKEAREYARIMMREGHKVKLFRSGDIYKVIVTGERGKGIIKFWHVTLAERVPSIKEKGLIPRYEPPAGQDWLPVEEGTIYLYPDKEIAKDHAEQMEEASGEKGAMAVLEITLPDTEENRERLGKGSEGEPIFEGQIEPQYIRRIK